jgi:acetyl-CoA carboxylase biotin carboxyl carrier protein
MSGISFDPDAIRALAQILRDTDLSEIELEDQGSRLRVSRTIAAAPVVHYATAPAAAPLTAVAPAAAVEAAGPLPITSSTEGVIASPMVGVAYLAPEPGATPFITLGARVAAGQTVLLIEAMKTFNQIKAPKAGTVTRILIESGAPVEYGAPLLIVE